MVVAIFGLYLSPLETRTFYKDNGTVTTQSSYSIADWFRNIQSSKLKHKEFTKQ